MTPLNIKDVLKYVEENIGEFHQKKITSLDDLKLDRILKRKNPYLFRAKNVLTSADIVTGLVDAHISSHEETIFGNWLEGLAIFINQRVFGGRKSGIEGIDLEFDHQRKRYIVSIKSGPNWGNSGQIDKMKDNFSRARRVIKAGTDIEVIAVNGCCYGIDNNPYKGGDYFKFCGQRFWAFISGDGALYTDIIEPLGYEARGKNEIFLESYAQKINRFVREFGEAYCKQNGEIDWEKLVRFNSGKSDKE